MALPPKQLPKGLQPKLRNPNLVSDLRFPEYPHSFVPPRARRWNLIPVTIEASDHRLLRVHGLKAQRVRAMHAKQVSHLA